MLLQTKVTLCEKDYKKGKEHEKFAHKAVQGLCGVQNTKQQL